MLGLVGNNCNDTNGEFGTGVRLNKVCRFSVLLMCFYFYCLSSRLTVAEWLTHSPATLEVTDTRHTFGGILFQRFISQIDEVSGTDEREGVCVACGIAGLLCDL